MVGSVNLDLGYRLERLPRDGETLRATERFEAGGGKGANQALAARRLGADVRLLASVGRDADAALADLAAEHVDLSTVIRHEDAATGSAVLLIGPEDNCIVIDPGANDLLRPADVRALAAAGTGLPAVVVTNHEVPAAVVEATVRAYAGRARVLLNPSPARAIEPEVLALVDVLVLNAGELADLLGLTSPPTTPGQVAALLERSTLGDAIVTIGAEGVVVFEGGAATRLPAFRVEAIDTVGAGDAFLGALAAGLAAGRTLCEAARRACAAAALAVTAHGARGAELTQEAVEALLGAAMADSRA